MKYCFFGLKNTFFPDSTDNPWAQWLINLKILVLVRSLKSSNVVNKYLDGRLFKLVGTFVLPGIVERFL